MCFPSSVPYRYCGTVQSKWAVLLTSNTDVSVSLVALAEQLRSVQTGADFAYAFDGRQDKTSRDRCLRTSFVRAAGVDTVHTVDAQKIFSSTHGLGNEVWSSTFIKLASFTLRMYSRVLAIDPDVVIVNPIDGVLTLKAPAMAIWQNIYNSGVLLVEPNATVYNSLLTAMSTGYKGSSRAERKKAVDLAYFSTVSHLRKGVRQMLLGVEST
jgi:alpha-N-acetylglucosamine transferase